MVAEDHGIPVTLGDIGTVEASLREDFTRAAANGETAVLIGISRQPSGNAVTISDGRPATPRRRSRAPTRNTSSHSSTIRPIWCAMPSPACATASRIGLLLAVATIFFFIADLRTTLVAAAVIPATVLISCVVLRALGMSFNLMTLGGIAAGIGLILDDAIVVIENLHRHRDARPRGEVGADRIDRRDHPRARSARR